MGVGWAFILTPASADKFGMLWKSEKVTYEAHFFGLRSSVRKTLAGDARLANERVECLAAGVLKQNEPPTRFSPAPLEGIERHRPVTTSTLGQWMRLLVPASIIPGAHHPALLLSACASGYAALITTWRHPFFFLLYELDTWLNLLRRPIVSFFSSITWACERETRHGEARDFPPRAELIPSEPRVFQISWGDGTARALHWFNLKNHKLALVKYANF